MASLRQAIQGLWALQGLDYLPPYGTLAYAIFFFRNAIYPMTVSGNEMNWLISVWEMLSMLGKDRYCRHVHVSIVLFIDSNCGRYCNGYLYCGERTSLVSVE